MYVGLVALELLVSRFLVTAGHWSHMVVRSFSKPVVARLSVLPSGKPGQLLCGLLFGQTDTG